MICDCGLLDMGLMRQREVLHLCLSDGVATVRPVETSVRVEHLNCGRCVGLFLRAPADGVGLAGCGCDDETRVRPSVEPTSSSSSVFMRSGQCSCGTMTWEDARDGALILQGVGDYHVWDREEDGAIVVVGGRCLECGPLTS